MNNPPAFFHGADNRDASSKLPFFPANFIGRLRIDACKGVTKRDGTKMFVAEFTVLTTNMPDKVYVGGRYSWCQSMKEPDTALGACIAFLYAALGLDPNRDRAKIESDIKPRQNDWLNRAASDQNILKDGEVNLQTAYKITKKGAGKTLEEAIKADAVFTLHNFSVAAPATAA